MTPQEAIRRIKNHNEIHSRKEQHFAIHITEALNIACEALEKQIPKEIRTEHITRELKRYYCPACNQHYYDISHKYCHFCGQALDWSDKE